TRNERQVAARGDVADGQASTRRQRQYAPRIIVAEHQVAGDREQEVDDVEVAVVGEVEGVEIGRVGADVAEAAVTIDRDHAAGIDSDGVGDVDHAGAPGR